MVSTSGFATLTLIKNEPKSNLYFLEKFNAACFIYELFVLWYHLRFQQMFRLHLEKSFEIVLYYLFY